METINRQDQKITVLGKSFNSEEERREYFREELRQKLPELKKMEGFPIGEDEDIIQLSDPPYYTACPNPWLNYFIAEWEEEKKELEKQGKRRLDFEVEEPFATDVSEGKNNPIYNAHSYHTKVPHPAIMRYILHYTQPGDVVLDGFAGTGMTGVAASLCEKPNAELTEKINNEFAKNGLSKPSWGPRKSIIGDLSPIASFIAYNYNSPIDAEEFEQEAKKDLKKVQANWNWLYETEHSNGKKGIINFIIWSDVFLCSVCDREITFWDVAVDFERDKILKEFRCPSCEAIQSKKSLKKNLQTRFDHFLKELVKQQKTVPVLINYSFGKRRYTKKPDDTDLALLDKIESYDVNLWVPLNRMPEGSESRRNDREGLTHVHHFHTSRNLIALAAYWNNIESDRNGLAALLAASAANPNFSKLRRFRSGKKGGGPLAGTLYISSINTPQNAFLSIGRNIDFLKKAFNITSGFRQGNSAIYTGTTTELSSVLKESVDYIFTDPPFGANIMYSELNFLWEASLRVRTNSTLEAIENKPQGKGFEVYTSLMTLSFQEYFRILKPGKWMTVEFSNTNAAIWNGIQTALQRAGFVIANIAALDKKQGSFKAVTTSTAVKQDLVISCYKPSSEFDKKFKQDQHNEVGIWDFIEEHFRHLSKHIVKDNSTSAIIERSPKILFDRLIAFYVQRGLSVPIDAGKFQQGLRERFIERDGMFFTNEQVQEYDRKKAEVPNFVQLSILVSSEQDGVLWLKNLLQDKPHTYQEINPKWMQALAGVRKGDIIPELADILEENFLKDSQGKWYVPDPENEADLEKLRNKRLLRQFEEYKVQANKPKGKIKEVRVEALRAGFKQAYQDKDFKTIVMVGDRIPSNLLMEDEVLLQFYDIASSKV